MSDITFAQPLYLWLLLIIPVLVLYYILRQHGTAATFTFSPVKYLDDMPRPARSYLRHILFGFRMLVIALLILIIARPQSVDHWEDRSTEGIDIMLSMDISSSMLARDFNPDRLEAAKNVATEFISGRPYDRMGLVIFSGESFTQCPLTTDHAVLINLMREMESGMIEDGTAIGLGLATAINRIKDSDAKSKVIILLTDGVNNRGEIAPVTAAEIAKTMGVRVYTIGVGSHGTAPYPVQTAAGIRYRNMKVEIDEDVLQEIAEITGGQYFRATDNESLNKIYEEIDKLEKSKISVQEYSNKKEEFMPLAIIMAALLLLEILIRYTVLKKYL
ncbi:MAG: VWA domain-containing protein [Bacteroidales bacterium]|nr:VWA domain-containing protein [Bacteroidales bacterium]